MTMQENLEIEPILVYVKLDIGEKYNFSLIVVSYSLFLPFFASFPLSRFGIVYDYG